MKKILLTLLFSLFLGTAWATDYTADANCLAALLMNADEDPLTDSSGEGNSAALKAAGEPDYTATGKYDGGYVFDGTNDYAQITDFVSTGTANLGICAWVYFDTSDTDDYISRYGDAFAKGYAFLRDDVGSTSGRTDCFTALVMGSVNSIKIESATNSAPSGSWIHTAFTLTASPDAPYPGVLRVYINGVEDANSPANVNTGGMIAPTTNLFIGAPSTTAANTMLDGSMDEFAYFNRLLSSTEINDIMDNGLVGAAPAAVDESQVFFISMKDKWTSPKY